MAQINLIEPMEKLLTIKEICDLLQVSRSTIYEWTHIEYIPHLKFSNGLRFRQSEIEKWLNRKKKVGRDAFRIRV